MTTKTPPATISNRELVLTFAELLDAWRREDWRSVESARRTMNAAGVIVAFGKKFDAGNPSNPFRRM